MVAVGPVNLVQFASGCRNLLTAGAAIGLLLGCIQTSSGQDSVPAAIAPALDTADALNPPRAAVQFNPGEEVEHAYSPQPRRFRYALLFRIRGVYDDNINLSQVNKLSDYYVAIEPTIAFGLGDIFEKAENYIRLDYSPSMFLFLDHSEDDALQHLIHLEGHHRFRRLDLTMMQDVQILDGADFGSSTNGLGGQFANVDVSSRTRVDIYTTQLRASYALTAKTSMSSGVNSTITHYPDLISSEVISGDLFINYAYGDKLTLGLGGTAGYNFVDDPNPDQGFEQANVRLSYQVAAKINLVATGGVEFRQFENGSRGAYISPVVDINATYQPFDGTSLSLEFSRRTLNSAVLAGQDFASTNLSASARQRLLQRVYLGFYVGYQNSDYFSTISGVNATRRDNYYYIQPAIDVIITRFWSAGAYYLHRQDESSVDQFTFGNNQVGFRTVLSF